MMNIYSTYNYICFYFCSCSHSRDCHEVYFRLVPGQWFKNWIPSRSKRKEITLTLSTIKHPEIMFWFNFSDFDFTFDFLFCLWTVDTYRPTAYLGMHDWAAFQILCPPPLSLKPLEISRYYSNPSRDLMRDPPSVDIIFASLACI